MVGRVMVSITVPTSPPMLIDIMGQRALRAGRLTIIVDSIEAKGKMVSVLNPSYQDKIVLLTLHELNSRSPYLFLDDTYFIVASLPPLALSKVREMLAQIPNSLGSHYIDYDTQINFEKQKNEN